ncbi:MAG: DUF881 domain-containing protein [Candidatus Berkelbacteria bacterium]
MKKTEIPKVIAIRLLIAIFCIGFGILISAQLRTLPERVINPIAPYVSLRDTKEELYTEQTQLKDEIKSLQVSIQESQIQAENVVLSKEEIAKLNHMKAQAGLTKLNGPGVIIILDDSATSVATESSIVHAADIRDVLNLLWGSGAEAIAINGQRVVINTAVDCIVNTILLNNVRLATPFQVEAIGNRDLMYDKVTNQKILTDLYKRKRENGVIFDVKKNDDITVPLFDGSLGTESNAN